MFRDHNGQWTNPDHHIVIKSVAHLGDKFHRGNVTVTRKKNITSYQPISSAKADRLPRGRRGQRKGLVYHVGYEGFDPETWQIVVRDHESLRLELAPVVIGALPTIVDIQRLPASTDAKLFDITSLAIEEHNMVQTDDGVGGMAGIGDRLGYDGNMHSFIMKHEELRGKLFHDLHFVAGKQFSKHFAGLAVGWEDRLKRQGELWPKPTPKTARCWDASENLGNSCHTDRDDARSFAVWLGSNLARGWWFLFPKHGVAVELTHGTWISWDGREQPHCSSVPCVSRDDRLLSLFASLPANLCSVFEREQACGSAIIARQAQDTDRVGSLSDGIFRQLNIGTPVMIRWVPEAPAQLGRKGKRRWGQSGFRWIACKVVALDFMSCLVEVREVSSPYWVHPLLSAYQVYNGLVIGHF
jgi:hypothetical protein